MRHAVEIDHFIPWARHPDDAIHNLVVAHRLPGDAKLWMRKNEFATFDRPSVETALMTAPRFDVAAEDIPPFDPDPPAADG